MDILNDSDEPLLTPTEDRFSLMPIKYQNIWDLYKKHTATYWTTAQIDFSQDIKDWQEKLNEDERQFITHALAFFNVADGIVNENLAVNMMQLVQIPEARCFYGFQIMMENVHAETYSIMIDTFIRDEVARAKALHGAANYPCIKKKADWALRWLTDKNLSFGTRLVAFACVEGIMFSSSFCSIRWLERRGLMLGLCTSNEYISRDEALHCDFACLLLSMLKKKPSRDEILKIVKEAVEIEKEFAVDSLQVRLLGMNSDLMKQYIEHTADVLLVGLMGEKYWNTKNPFDFTIMLTVNGRHNFFEKHISNYAKANVFTTTSSSNPNKTHLEMADVF